MFPYANNYVNGSNHSYGVTKTTGFTDLAAENR